MLATLIIYLLIYLIKDNNIFVFKIKLMQAEIANKLKQLNTGNPMQGLKSFLTVRPVGCKTKATLVQDLEGFQSLMNKIP